MTSTYKALECEPEDLYTYSAQRWIWNEARQLRRRLSFDLNGLVQIAEQAAGENAVYINVSKLPEGNFKHGVSGYHAGRAGARDILQLPVPKVLTYCSRATESKLGAEYIVMEKAPGIELSYLWDALKPREKLSIVKKIGSITSTLVRVVFPYHGSLYLREDVLDSESIKFHDTFSVGPTTGSACFDGRSTSSTINVLAQRELACVTKFSKFPRDCQQGIFNGPGGYHPTKEAKLSILHNFLKIYQCILPKDDALNAGIIWHNDLHTNNIFVDKNDPTKITSIIDWQAVPIYPMFLIAHHPSLIEYDDPKPEQFVQPTLPSNIERLDPQDKKAATGLFLSQTLWLYYETQVYKEAPQLIDAFKYRETLPAELPSLVSSVCDDGEPHVQNLLATVATDDIWKILGGEDDHGNPSVPCPLHYTESDLAKQSAEYVKWEADIERKARVIDELGVYTGWNGAVSPGHYDEVVRRVQLAKERFLDRESKTPEERAPWEKAWPFGDKPGE